METYTKYVVRTKHKEGKPDKYFKKTINGWTSPRMTLSKNEYEMCKFDTYLEAQDQVNQYVGEHKKVDMKDLEIVKVEFSAKVIEVTEVKKS